MRKDIEFCGTQLTKQGYPWGIVTNGVLLTQQRLSSLINAGLSSITISLDGLESSHNWLRNSKSFVNVIRAVELIIEQEMNLFLILLHV